MPGVEDWVNRPLEVVDRISDQHGENCHDKVVDYFAERLKEPEALHLVPSLNDVPLHQLQPNGLVRFRCMIQDMFNTEFYLGTYEVVDKQNRHRLKCGLYKDIMDCTPVEEVDMNSQRNKIADRMLYYCVSVAGENLWVKEGFHPVESATYSCSSSVGLGRFKRSLDSDDDNDIEMVDHEVDNDHKKICPDASSNGKTDETSTANVLQNLNFPLPNEEGVACLVKLYSSYEHLKVTDVIEFIGILSVDPQLECTNLNSDCNKDGEMEMAAHNPPPSLVPRLHAIIARSFPHNIPYLPAEVKLNDSSAIEILSQAKRIREELIGILAEVLLGDVLAAEYLLFHLISSVYFRQDVTVLGKFCLNLISFPLQEEYAKAFYRLLQKFVAKSYFLELSLENLNSKPFSPWKDYSSDRLISGILQLSPHTHLVIDETALNAGQLENKGVQNVAALKHLIQWQNVEYDYKYHKISYQCNIAILVLSEGKSLLGSDCQVKLAPHFVPEDLTTHLSNLESRLSDDALKQFRTYLTLLKLAAKCDLNEEISKIVEGDFVAMRKENPKMSADDLHLLLVLGRFQSLSIGEMALTKESWEKVKRMEEERRSRLPPTTSA